MTSVEWISMVTVSLGIAVPLNNGRSSVNPSASFGVIIFAAFVFTDFALKEGNPKLSAEVLATGIVLLTVKS